MPMDKSKYPPNWDEISHRIRFERAGGRCEECGLSNGAEIIRSDIDPAYFVVWDEAALCYRYPHGERVHWDDLGEEYNPDNTIRVVLTVHHIGVDKPDGSPGSPDDKMDCRDENLIALCQRDHLMADRQWNLNKRRYNRLEAKREAAIRAGQMELFE